MNTYPHVSCRGKVEVNFLKSRFLQKSADSFRVGNTVLVSASPDDEGYEKYIPARFASAVAVLLQSCKDRAIQTSLLT